MWIMNHAGDLINVEGRHILCDWGDRGHIVFVEGSNQIYRNILAEFPTKDAAKRCVLAIAKALDAAKQENRAVIYLVADGK